jgi:hypothetical protein
LPRLGRGSPDLTGGEIMPKYPLAYYRQLPDIANDETENILDEMTAEIESVYGQAYMEMHKKAVDYLAWFQDMDAVKRQLFQDGKITKKEYADWRKNKLLTGMHWIAMREGLADALVNADGIAYSIIRDYVPEVYSINGNWTTYVIEHATKINTSFELFDEQTIERMIRDHPDLLPQPSVNIPLDMRWNKNNINSAVMQSIIQGESVDELANRLAEVTDMNQASAIRNAKTATTSAQNGGRQDAYERAETFGIVMRKMWLATPDYHTRASHRRLDGETIGVNEKFSNGLEFPGDSSGLPAEVYGCRCRMITVFPDQGDLARDPDRFSRLDSLLGSMSYDEWKTAHGTEKPFKAARNENRDMRMHDEYRDLLGKKCPRSFDDFQDVKYNHPSQWKQMVSDARKARNARRRKP